MPEVGAAASSAKSPLVGAASFDASFRGKVDGSSDGGPPVCAVRWPWKIATTHVHFMKEKSVDHFLCWRGQQAKPVDHLDGGDDIMAALVGGKPACKRCMRALPREVREEVLRLTVAAGL